MSDRQRLVDPNRVSLADATQGSHRADPTMTNHANHVSHATTEPTDGNALMTKPTLGRQDSSETIDAKPKSTFKITSVTLHSQKGSSQDGRHSFGEEDEESAVDDSLVQTDPEDSPAPANNLSDIIKQQKQDRVDSTSRFKVVKIQKREPYSVGRWRISDFMSEPDVNSSKVVQDATHAKRSDSGNSSRASSTHYVHGVDDPSKNPLASINAAGTTATSNPPLPSIQQSPLTQPSGALAGLTNDSASTLTNSNEATHTVSALHANTGKTEHIDSNNISYANGDSIPGNNGGSSSSGNAASGATKDPHLIDQHAMLSSNQLANPHLTGGSQQAVSSLNQQYPGIPTEQSTATAQANTQVGSD